MSIPPFLLRLMLVPRLGIRLTRPEDQICAEFASALRALALEARLSCVFTHVANEIGYDNNPTLRKKAQLAYAIAKALGFTTGTADYLFLWNGGSGAIEFKSGSGRQTDAQKDFAQWCALNLVPYEIARSSDQGIAILKNWGCIDNDQAQDRGNQAA